MNVDVSVIVPAYNVELYIAECLDSLLVQEVPELQIICVDDGSTDGTPGVLEAYAQRNDCIQVVTKSNGGLSSARNEGLSYAIGEYVHFCDADDLLKPGSLARLVERARCANADIVYFDADSFFEDEALRENHAEYETYYHRQHCYGDPTSGIRLLVEMSKRNEWLPSVPIQLYRRAFLQENNLQFIPGITHEDNAFSYCAAIKAEVVFHFGESFYLRRVRGDSIMTSGNSSKNVIGYYRCFLAMVDAVSSSGAQVSELLDVPHGVLMAARDIYRKLPSHEQAACSDAFAGANRAMFLTLVAKDSVLLENLDAARGEISAIKQSRRYLLAERLARIVRR